MKTLWYKNICCYHFSKFIFQYMYNFIYMTYLFHSVTCNHCICLSCKTKQALRFVLLIASSIFIYDAQFRIWNFYICNIKMMKLNYFYHQYAISSYHSQFQPMLPFSSSKLISSATTWPSVTHLFLLITFCIGPGCSISCTYPGDRDDRWI